MRLRSKGKTKRKSYLEANKSKESQRLHYPDLFCIIGVGIDKQLGNLVLLLGDDEDIANASVVNLPINEDVAAMMFGQEEEVSIHISKMYAVVWADGDGKYNWFLRYVTKEHVNEYTVDHLHRFDSASHLTWAYPVKEDIFVVEASQILPCVVLGEWDLKDSRSFKFDLKNIRDILAYFSKFIE